MFSHGSATTCSPSPLSTSLCANGFVLKKKALFSLFCLTTDFSISVQRPPLDGSFNRPFILIRYDIPNLGLVQNLGEKNKMYLRVLTDLLLVIYTLFPDSEQQHNDRCRENCTQHLTVQQKTVLSPTAQILRHSVFTRFGNQFAPHTRYVYFIYYYCISNCSIHPQTLRI